MLRKGNEQDIGHYKWQSCALKPIRDIKSESTFIWEQYLVASIYNENIPRNVHKGWSK